MVAKILAYGANRQEALARLRRALDQTTIVIRDGISNKSFLQDLLARDRNRHLRSSTSAGWTAVGDEISSSGMRNPDVALVAAALSAYESTCSSRSVNSSRRRCVAVPRSNRPSGRTSGSGTEGRAMVSRFFGIGPRHFRVEIDGSTIDVTTEVLGSSAGTKLRFGGRSHGSSLRFTAPPISWRSTATPIGSPTTKAASFVRRHRASSYRYRSASASRSKPVIASP